MQLFKTLFFLFITFLHSAFFAQNTATDFILPLDRMPIVTGNYAELRPNHFNAGLDFSTDPTINLPIKSIGDGYVSRIKISSGGYGNALYITHPNGYVSVYAHQKKYATTISNYVKQKQIAQQKNEIELFLTPTEIQVKKGEIVGYTGNSGSSTAPHLHFEIRDEKTETPLNPLLFYPIKDDIKPIATHLALYDATDSINVKLLQTMAITNIKNTLSLKTPSITLINNVFAISYSGFDVANGSFNKNNIYEAKISVDNVPYYQHQLNNISFNDARYVNVFSEKINGIKYQKCFTPICQNVGMYKLLKHNGIIELPDTLFHKITFTFTDERGNFNTIEFYVKSKNTNGYNKIPTRSNVFCNTDFTLKDFDAEISIKVGSLLQNAIVYIQAIKKNETYKIKSTHDFLMKAIQVSFKPKSILQGKESKMVMLCNQSSIGGILKNGLLTADSKSFGIYTYTYDTIAPVMTLFNKKAVEFKNSISFKITDDISGIKDFNLFINDVWQIAEYDAKNAKVTCYFNNETPKGNVDIKFVVTDRVDNESVFKTQITIK